MLRYTLTTPDGLSGLPAAASLALTVLQLGQVRRWSDLDGVIPDCVVLDDEQFRLLSVFQTEISFLRSTEKKTKDSAGIPGVSMAVCPECGKWLLITSGDAPRKCSLTNGCAGSPVKATAAARVKSSDAVDVPVSLFDDDEPLHEPPEPDQPDEPDAPNAPDEPVFMLEPETAPDVTRNVPDGPAVGVPEPGPGLDPAEPSEPVFAALFGAGDF